MDKHAQQPQIEVQDIDHLGIVAGIIDEIGLAEEIDRRVGTHPQEHLSSSQAVKAMILNGLGFVSAPLYLFGEFFSGKAAERFGVPTKRAFTSMPPLFICTVATMTKERRSPKRSV
jgi:transposase